MSEGATRSIRVRRAKGSNNDGGTHSKLLSQAQHLKKTQLNEIRKRKRDFLTRIHYTNFATVVVFPGLVLLYVLYNQMSISPQNTKTLIFTVVYFNITLLSFTAGYHKCFAHNTFKLRSRPLMFSFGIFGASLGLGSIRNWAALHRAHHQFTDDTVKDPHLIKRGFLWAHWGWLIKKPKILTFYKEFIEQEFPQDYHCARNIVNEVNVDVPQEYTEFELLRSDYEYKINQFVLWQRRWYFPLLMVTTLVIPGLVAKYICHDTFINGIIYPGVLRMLLCQQAILITESVCHMSNIGFLFPTQVFSEKNSSQNCNNPLISFLTYGQLRQNFHHEFPHDYRCGHSAFDYDPTKWFIWGLSCLGLVEELSKTPLELITQLQIQQQQQVINRVKSQLNWGTPLSKLPLITPRELNRIVNANALDRIYIIIQNIIHDITPFMDQHPGGVALLKASHGKDATKAFYGGVYGHLTAAVNLLATMRIGVLDVGNDEEVWKRVVTEEGSVKEAVSSRGDSKQYRTAEAA
ncbi:uncharacterized protein KQ657_002054 [Scheffersomyces spartinae]|uniref:Acyl-CoA desaturase n=1 Tax=Scheffersomyces spartinae TaxID=45513 RepID=A0A9P7VCN6_9ASCO|nr:uncharacterized protein KQ657_002054 [Scheffersomyces spartinae]KAG7195673.1 hypothetical protein KQ657_002054 [Scheffersomyces spartinae]